MDNNLSSMLYALNTYHQRTQIDKNSLLAGKIEAFNKIDADATTALRGAVADIVIAHPDPNTYEVINVTFAAVDATQIWVVITIRVN
jgi:hypothetical protein